METILTNWLIALPEIALLCLGSCVLLLEAFVPGKQRIVTYYAVQISLVIAFIITLPQFKEYGAPVTTFGGHYVVDKLAILSKLIMYLFSFFAFAYGRDYLNERKVSRGEYYLLGLFAVLGMSIMVSAFSLLTIYLGLELSSLALYAMIALQKESVPATEGAMKYFVLGSFASGILLYGMSLLYGATGNIQIDTIGTLLAQHPGGIALVGLIFILAGLLFKFGAVPFHMWVPDVYQGAATPTTLFIASAPKVAAFAITVRLLVGSLPTFSTDWQQMLIVVSILSMFFGNLLAIAQTNIKRMLAYSSIAHIGYTLLGILAGPNSSDGYSAAMFYIATYVLVAAGGFAIIAILSHKDMNFERLEDYRGLNARSPWLAFMMLLLLFSMAGVPPTVGFFAKLGLLEALVEAKLVWLAVLALVFALIGAYYYLRVVMLMYFEEPNAEVMSEEIVISTDMRLLITINGSAALILGVFPSFFIDLCRISVG